MRLGRGGWVLVILTAGVGFAGLGLAVAQTGDDGQGEGGGQTTGEVSARRRAELTPAEQLAESQRIQERGSTLSRRVAGMLDEARRENDVIRVTCLDDKLTQINAHLRTLGSRLESLQEASQLGDEGRRNHEFTVITVLGQNLTELDRAANECIGQDLFETGTTRVTTTIDPSVPNEDPSVIPVPVAPTVPFIPPPASCTDPATCM
jgi:hypothetical protein